MQLNCAHEIVYLCVNTLTYNNNTFIYNALSNTHIKHTNTIRMQTHTKTIRVSMRHIDSTHTHIHDTYVSDVHVHIHYITN